MSLYATKAEIQDQAVVPDSLRSRSWDGLIAGASRMMDQMCGVSADFFAKAGSSATSRTFYGDGTAFLRLDPYAAATTPVLTMETGYDEPTWIEQGDEGCQFLIVNEELKRQDLTEYDSWANRFTGWPDRVSVAVSAKWGFTEIPDEVKQATIELAIAMFRRNDPAKLRLNNIDTGYVRESLPATTKAVCARLKAKYSRDSAFV